MHPQRSRLVHSLQSHSDFTSSPSPASLLPSSNLHAFGPPKAKGPCRGAQWAIDLTLDVFRQRGSWKLDREPGAVRDAGQRLCSVQGWASGRGMMESVVGDQHRSDRSAFRCPRQNLSPIFLASSHFPYGRPPSKVACTGSSAFHHTVT